MFAFHLIKKKQIICYCFYNILPLNCKYCSVKRNEIIFVACLIVNSSNVIDMKAKC